MESHTLLGSVCFFVATALLLARNRKIRPQQRASLLIRGIGAGIFPHALASLVPRPPLVALLWNVLSFALDVIVGIQSGPRKITFHPQHFTGIAFGLASMVGCKPETPHSRLFMYAILLCFLVVIPSHDFPAETHEAAVFDALQTTALHWCVGLVLAAIAVARRSSHAG